MAEAVIYEVCLIGMNEDMSPDGEDPTIALFERMEDAAWFLRNFPFAPLAGSAHTAARVEKRSADGEFLDIIEEIDVE